MLKKIEKIGHMWIHSALATPTLSHSQCKEHNK